MILFNYRFIVGKVRAPPRLAAPHVCVAVAEGPAAESGPEPLRGSFTRGAGGWAGVARGSSLAHSFKRSFLMASVSSSSPKNP